MSAQFTLSLSFRPRGLNPALHTDTGDNGRSWIKRLRGKPLGEDWVLTIKCTGYQF